MFALIFSIFYESNKSELKIEMGSTLNLEMSKGAKPRTSEQKGFYDADENDVYANYVETAAGPDMTASHTSLAPLGASRMRVAGDADEETISQV